ncbi:MAG: NADH-quinone oxidoreductase subunit H, partial [Alicyclobacillus sp.]|nr:NADH-quinone oxidoreductase subunit H [Alicyclobacillus sp.]
MANFGVGLLQTFLLLGLSPLIQGVIKKLKALLQGRSGPTVWQPYFDLKKYLCKDEVVSTHASWLFLATPYLVFSAMLTAAALVPTGTTYTAVPGAG